MRQIALAFRTLFKTPFVTVVAILSLALGIGANAAIYSMFDQLLRRPLQVPHADRLVNLGAPGPKPGSQSCGQAGDCDAVFSYPMFRDLEKAKTPFTGIAGHFLFGTNISYHNQAKSTEGVFVSGSYFPVLGIAPAAGRLLTPNDDKVDGANFVAVLSYRYWDSELGHDASVVGQQLFVNGRPMTIVGVAPRGFDGTTLGAQPDVFVPISMRAALNPTFRGLQNRQTYWIYLFGRLKPGTSLERATAGINSVYQPIIQDVEAPLQKGMSAQTMARFRAKKLTLSDGRRGQSSIDKDAKSPLLMLFGITGIVLLIACANIANLLLARAANRSMEMAVRLSLGASRRQVLTQLLTESCLLAVLGGAVSLLIAFVTLRFIASLLPADMAASLHFSLHMTAVWFAAGLSIGTGILFGLYPALHSTRPDLVTTLRANSGKQSSERSATRFRTSLVTVQIALSMALLISAGLFIKSLRNVSRVDLGIKIDHIATFGISPGQNGYDAARSRQLFDRVTQELGALPGVQSVAYNLVPLIAGNNWGNDVSVQGFKKGPDTDANSRFNEVSAAYFTTIGEPLLAGREFTAADRIGAPKVAIVNQAFAKKFHLGNDVVGKLMSMGSDSLDIQIVGFAHDAKYSEVKGDIPPVFFIPIAQDSENKEANFYVRTAAEPSTILHSIPGLMKRLDPNLPVENLKTLPQQVKENVFLDRMISVLSVAFALLATLLAAIGLYGVLAYSVAQRTREIGVRMALGANAGNVRAMVLRNVGLMTLVGGVVGIVGAVFLGRAAKSLLFELQGTDPWVIAGAAIALSAVSFAAGYLPARRASRVDPMQALRYE
jgi:predicted permease